MTVTGTSASRLGELLKYTITSNFMQQYIIYDVNLGTGVDYNVSLSNQNVTYYINEIKYHDVIVNGITKTSYEFNTLGSLSPDFIHVNYIKKPEKENIISNPKINDDVFITRPEISAFENNYRLEYIKSIQELETYAGGKYFNIVNNT
jgi:hypothetical protein